MWSNFYNWFVLSSKNPEQLSLTLKAGAPTVIAIVTILLGFAHVQVGDADLSGLADGVIALIQLIVTIFGTLLTVYGLVRKIYRSYEGTHASVNAAE